MRPVSAGGGTRRIQLVRGEGRDNAARRACRASGPARGHTTSHRPQPQRRRGAPWPPHARLPPAFSPGRAAAPRAPPCARSRRDSGRLTWNSASISQKRLPGARGSSSCARPAPARSATTSARSSACSDAAVESAARIDAACRARERVGALEAWRGAAPASLALGWAGSACSAAA